MVSTAEVAALREAAEEAEEAVPVEAAVLGAVVAPAAAVVAHPLAAVAARLRAAAAAPPPFPCACGRAVGHQTERAPQR